MGKFIPISKIEERKTKLSENHFNSGYYPLFESYNRKENYNYENLRESAYRWNNYSANVADNFSRILELFDIVKENNNGTQLQEFTNIINNHIIPYIKSPSVFKNNILKRLDEDSNNVYLTSILDKINEQEECDRVIRNHNMISKRFNIDKLVSQNILFEDAVTDTIYKLCELVDTYNLDFKSKFCIANEMALYTINKYAGDTISSQTIFENVTDYYLINGGTNNIPKFLNKIREATKADDFINKSNTSYIDKLEIIYNKYYGDFNPNSIYEDFNNINNNAFNFNGEAAGLFIESAIESLYEEAISDKINNMITAFKMAPIKTIGLVKRIINAIFSNIKEKDLPEKTKKALSLASFSFKITMNSAKPLIALQLIIVNSLGKFVSKKYLKDCILQWKAHKSNIQRKMDSEKDIDKKRKLEKYLNELNFSINKLENKYKDLPDISPISYIDFEDTDYNRKNLSDIDNKFKKELHETVLQEGTLNDKINLIVSKFKSLPEKTITSAKNAIRAVLVTSRLQDIRSGTRNALSIAFYTIIALNAFAVSMCSGLLSVIAIYIINSKTNKKYLADSIEEWKNHKYYISKKIKEEQNNEKKERLKVYLEEVNKNIEDLENAYEKIRDKTTEEMDKEREERNKKYPEYIKGNASINPFGKETSKLYHNEKQNKINDKNTEAGKKEDPDFDDDDDFDYDDFD